MNRLRTVGSPWPLTERLARFLKVSEQLLDCFVERTIVWHTIDFVTISSFYIFESSAVPPSRDICGGDICVGC